MVKAVCIGEHDLVELASAWLVHIAGLQRLQIQPHRRNRRLEFVGDGVDEGVVVLAAPDLKHQEHGVDDQAGNDEGEGDDAEYKRRGAFGVVNNPADDERHGCRH